MPAAGFFTMNISSKQLDFGLTCPGSLMQELQKDKPDQVRSLKTLRTSLAKGYVDSQCHVGCGDLVIAEDFIKSIDALEELSIINFEPDARSLWPAISHHAASLKRLAVHTPPQKAAKFWMPSKFRQLGEVFRLLSHIEMDVPLLQVEKMVNVSASGGSMDEELFYRLKELFKMVKLQSVLINVVLGDGASTFAGKHKYNNVTGCISFPEPEKTKCKQLAQLIFDTFHASDAGCAMEQVEVRFPRRYWDDRGQFYTMAYSVRVRKGTAGVEVDEDDTWKDYLPPWPSDGVLGLLVEEANHERYGENYKFGGSIYEDHFISLF